MAVQFYNSYSRTKESFKPIHEGKVGLYTCGPTVYDFAHIGNFRTFMFEDLLKRWLLHSGYEVKHVMNITDVDDKTIKKAGDKGVRLQEITERYTSHFMEDLEWLKIIPADYFPRATDYIPTMIKMIEILIKKEMAYREDDGSIYFNIQSFPEYGQLTNIKLVEQKQSNRVQDDEYDKESPQDFALWKGWKEEDGDTVWDAPWGKGRPGWHIECSAMSSDTLGDHFDIHCGGVDNMFPHHENEIAQSKCATGKKFVNFWLHSEFLLVDGGKMSKSLGNFYRIADLKDLGFSAESIRYQLLSGHYRTKISFSVHKKNESDKIVQRMTDFHSLLERNNAGELSDGSFPDAYEDFKASMNDDLDTPRALAIFLEWMKSENKRITDIRITDTEIGQAWAFLSSFNSIFGFVKESELDIPDEIQLLLNSRQKARDEKDWARSDALRTTLRKHGWKVEDTQYGQKLKKA